MKITKVRVEFDNNGVLDFNYPGGFDLGDIPGALGISAGNLVEAESGTVQHALHGLITVGLNILAKRFGL